MKNSISRRDFFKKITGVTAITASASRPAAEAVNHEAIKNHKQNVQSKLFQSFPKTARNADGGSRQ